MLRNFPSREGAEAAAVVFPVMPRCGVLVSPMLDLFLVEGNTAVRLSYATRVCCMGFFPSIEHCCWVVHYHV